jgi:anthranilate synthase/aminodeoxychorismate synthase-like glutamine amidotransferase
VPSARVLVIDNYDSFTYNLVQALATLGARCDVALNDAIDIAEVRRRRPDAVLISPGPCSPDESGVSLSVIRAMAGELPIFGVCLGHQAIAQVFGGRVIRAGRVMHGKTSPIRHDGRSIHTGVPDPFLATRYHSLLVERSSLPEALAISAWTDEGEIMGLRHAELPIEGVQYHPESILTDAGVMVLGNWLASIPSA